MDFVQQFNCALTGVSFGGSQQLLPSLVGVACGGSCYREYASIWSDVALAHGDRYVFSQEECRDLCDSHGEACDVWTFWSLELKCELFRSYSNYNNNVLTFHDSNFVVTSPKDCYSTVWLPFLQPTTKPEEEKVVSNNNNDNNCWRKNSDDDIVGYSFGVSKDGACRDAEIISIYAPLSILELGLTQQWWSRSTTDLYATIISEFYCQQACDNTANCGGWQFINQNVCILKSKLDCTPTVARINKSSSAFRSSTAGVQGCIDDFDLVEEQNESNTNNNDCQKVSRCTSPQDDYDNAYWMQDTFLPAGNDCYYQYVTPRELRQGCLQNRWMVIAGASNVLSFYIQVLQLFTKIEPKGPLDPFISNGLTFAYSLMDVVLDENGVITYVNTKQFCEIDPTLRCGGSLVFQAGQMDWGAKYPAALQKALLEAPAGSTRITMVMGHLWSHMARTLESLHQLDIISDSTTTDHHHWQDANIMFYGQAMIWYPCYLEGWCKDSTMGSTNEQVFDKLQTDVDDLLQVGQYTCATNRFDCFFASHGYGGERIGPRARSMMAILKDSLHPYNDWAHYIDYNPILRATYGIRENGVVDGHLLPAMMVISQTMIWNTICPDLDDTICPQAIQMEPTCWADCETHKQDEDECNNCGPEDWMCMSSRQCNYKVLSDSASSSLLQLEGNGGSEDQLSSMDCFNSKTIGIPNTSHDSVRNSDDTNACDDQRIWCGTTADSWIVSCIVFVLGLSATLYGDKLWDYIIFKIQKEKKNEPRVDDCAYSEDYEFSEDEDSVHHDEENKNIIKYYDEVYDDDDDEDEDIIRYKDEIHDDVEDDEYEDEDIIRYKDEIYDDDGVCDDDDDDDEDIIRCKDEIYDDDGVCDDDDEDEDVIQHEDEIRDDDDDEDEDGIRHEDEGDDDEEDGIIRYEVETDDEDEDKDEDIIQYDDEIDEDKDEDSSQHDDEIDDEIDDEEEGIIQHEDEIDDEGEVMLHDKNGHKDEETSYIYDL